LAVDITSSGLNDLDSAISRIKLYRGDTFVKTESVSTSSATSATITFDDIDLTIEKDNTEEFVIKADFKDLGSDFTEGDYVAFDIDAADVTAEDSQGDSVSATGSAVGGNLYCYDDAIQVEPVELSGSLTFSPQDSGEYGVATYTIKFNVTAFDGDMYIITGASEADASGSHSASTAGIWYDLIADNNESAIEGTLAASVHTDASEQTYSYKIPEGQTKEFTLTVVATASSSNDFAKVGLEGIYWNTSDTTTGAVDYTYGLDEDWQTNKVFLEVK